MLTSTTNNPYPLQKKPVSEKTGPKYLNYIFPAKLCVAALIALVPCVFIRNVPEANQLSCYIPWGCCSAALIIQSFADRFLFDKKNLRDHTAIKILRCVFSILPLVPLCRMGSIFWTIIDDYNFIFLLPVLAILVLLPFELLLWLQITDAVIAWTKKSIFYDIQLFSTVYLGFAMLSMLFVLNYIIENFILQ